MSYTTVLEYFYISMDDDLYYILRLLSLNDTSKFELYSFIVSKIGDISNQPVFFYLFLAQRKIIDYQQ